MQSILSRAPGRGTARSNLLERQLGRFAPPVQRAVRGLAARHERLADLALSFPALLFTLAAARPGLDPARAIEGAIRGVALAEVAAAAGVPMWLRRLPPEAFSCPIAGLPDSKAFRRRIANHLPSRKTASMWLQAVAEISSVAHEAGALWIAREVPREKRDLAFNRLRLIGLWMWFSWPERHELVRKPWTPDMRLKSALSAADDWRLEVELHVSLGREPMADLWLKPARVCGFDFEPLASASDIIEEAEAMKNCLRGYGYSLAHNYARLWSVRRDGRRVATLRVAAGRGDPLLNVVELKAVGNADASPEASLAARQWLHMHDLSGIDTKPRRGGSAPFDRATWMSLWRPYWLAKRRIPDWLPLSPSRRALTALA